MISITIKKRNPKTGRWTKATNMSVSELLDVDDITPVYFYDKPGFFARLFHTKAARNYDYQRAYLDGVSSYGETILFNIESAVKNKKRKDI